MTIHNEYKIRPAKKGDAEAIARIYSASILARDSTMVLDPVNTAEMEEKLASLGDREVILVAQDGATKVVGWGIVKLYSDRPGYRLTCETSLFVESVHRGKGIGTALQTKLLENARLAGFHHVLVRIWAQNEASISLHRKLGFDMVGVQKEIGHVDQKWIDVAVMQCLLD